MLNLKIIEEIYEEMEIILKYQARKKERIGTNDKKQKELLKMKISVISKTQWID